MKRLLLTLCLIPSISFGQLITSGGATGGGSGDALTTGTLAQFAATTSSQFKGVISDENAPDGASSKVIMALGSLSIASGKTLTSSNTLTLAGTDATTLTFPGASTTIVGTTDTQTLTNKRIDPRTATSATNNTTPTPDVSTTDEYIATAMTVNMVFGAPTGSPVQGTKLMIRIKDSGSIRTIGWNATYVPIGVTLPTTTVANKLIYVGCIYNSTVPQWDVVAVSSEQ